VLSQLLLIPLMVTYIILIRRFSQGWKRISLYKPDKERIEKSQTKVSVVIAFRNEGENVIPLLEKLENQSYSNHQLELIMVNDHSEDQTFKLLKGNKTIENLKVFNLDNEFGKKAALTKGVAEASGELIVFTDADCSFNDEWIELIVEKYQESNFKIAVLPVLIKPVNSLVKKLQALDFLAIMASGLAGVGANKPFMCNGANLALERKAFEEVDGYVNDKAVSGDDVFLLHKIKEKYGKESIHSFSDKGLVVTTKAEEHISSFINQRARWASKARFYKDPFSTFVSWLILLVNLQFLFITFFSFQLLIILVLLKLVIDSFFLRKVLIHFDETYSPFLLLLTQLFMLFYFPLVIAKVLQGSIKWKGRSLNY